MNTKNLINSLSLILLGAVIAFAINHFFFANHQHHEDEHAMHDDHGHGHGHDDHEEEEKGPHGGKLFEQDSFALEMIFFEQGVPSEIRLYPSLNGEAVNLAQVKVAMTLNRLGGEQNIINFTPENDYLLSDQSIPEPHSFNVIINASHQGKNYQWQFESHEGRSEINDRLIEQSGIKTEIAGSQTIHSEVELYGIIETPTNKATPLFSPYPSTVEKVHVRIGDQVRKGQKLATLKNTKTLQTYELKSPAKGQISERWVNDGEIVHKNPLLEVTDLTWVWVELSAFPASIRELKKGQTVLVSTLHGNDTAQGKLQYIAPTMTEGHIARARSVIRNSDGKWRPGMHIKAKIIVNQTEVPLAVKTTAIQSFRDMPVVFAKYGNQFEVRMLELGKRDGQFVEVLSGLQPGTEYVTQNSYLLKADAMKGGATHDH